MIKEVEISEVFDIIRNGYSIKQSSTSKGVPITRIETISNRVIDESKLGYANLNDDNLGKAESYLLEPGDILMTHINSISHLGKCAIYQGTPKKLIHGMNLLCLRAKKDVAYPNYLLYYFNSIYFKSKLNKYINPAVNQASVSTGNLKKLSIPLPPLETQRKIAEILDASDTLRQKTKTLIEIYDQLTQSLFLELFGNPMINNMSWISKELKHLGKVVTGSTPSSTKKDMFGGSIPFVTPGDLETLDPVKRTLTELGSINSRTVKKGSLLVCCIGATIGKTDIAKEMSAFNQQINAVEWFNEVNSLYALIAFKYLRQKVISRGISTTLPILKKSEFEKIKLPLPPLPLQNQFAERVQAIEVQKAKALASQEKSEELFQSLLQKAFRGEIN